MTLAGLEENFCAIINVLSGRRKYHIWFVLADRQAIFTGKSCLVSLSCGPIVHKVSRPGGPERHRASQKGEEKKDDHVHASSPNRLQGLTFNLM
jgi:hypothetical protein